MEPEVGLNKVLIDDLPPINNDHVPDAERGLIYLSANDGHIYVAPIEGGSAKRVTHDSSRYHFLQGVSPDGATLASVSECDGVRVWALDIDDLLDIARREVLPALTDEACRDLFDVYVCSDV